VQYTVRVWLLLHRRILFGAVMYAFLIGGTKLFFLTVKEAFDKAQGRTVYVMIDQGAGASRTAFYKILRP
jgi:hypothetical protein